MSGWVYRRVTADWHWLKTPEGLFFGRSKEEVFGKARQHEALERARQQDALRFAAMTMARSNA
jgi:hypothetical protein